jgi:hypothetical protein
MKHSVALTTSLHNQAAKHLLRPDHQEDICFAIWHPSRGRDRVAALLHTLVLPNEGERQVHGNASFNSQYFERALRMASELEGGVALLHSHPGGIGWQDMSYIDVAAEQGHAAAVKGATSLPLVGLIMAGDRSLSARFWEKSKPHTYERHSCETVRVVGESFNITYYDRLKAPPPLRPELTRTVSVWGEAKQATLARLRIGVVGAGSIGSMVAESLARMGIAEIRLFDFDAVEIINLDRLLYAIRRDALLQLPKVDVLAHALKRSATASTFTIEANEYSIVEEEGFRAALDCDLLFSCVDRPWPRSVLNFIAYAHLIPVVDGGILATAKANGTGMHSADWRAHIATPGRPCLECLGQYDSGLVAAERDGYLDDPTYIAGLPNDHPVRRNENVFSFSMSAASFEVLQFLSMVVAPCGIADPGPQMYHFATGRLDIDKKEDCIPQCYFRDLVAHGDHANVTVTGRHQAAEIARAKRRQMQRSWSYRLQVAIYRLLTRWL